MCIYRGLKVLRSYEGGISWTTICFRILRCLALISCFSDNGCYSQIGWIFFWCIKTFIVCINSDY